MIKNEEARWSGKVAINNWQSAPLLALNLIIVLAAYFDLRFGDMRDQNENQELRTSKQTGLRFQANWLGQSAVA